MGEKIGPTRPFGFIGGHAMVDRREKPPERETQKGLYSTGFCPVLKRVRIVARKRADFVRRGSGVPNETDARTSRKSIDPRTYQNIPERSYAPVIHFLSRASVNLWIEKL